jgi:hypothetical protein
VAGFEPSTFSFTQHSESRFPLVGAHQAVVCNECHKTTEPETSNATTQFRLTDLSCTGCHRDPHRGEFQAGSVTADSPRTWNCKSCHTEDSWFELADFDHSTTDFPLRDAHRTVTCLDCHLPSTPQTGIDDVTFQGAPTFCAGCHEDVHGRQFDAVDGVSACDACHTSTDWKKTLFDHNRDSSFLLTGAHEDVPCRLCHTDQRQIAGRAVVTYRGTSSKCEACHSQVMPDPAPIVLGAPPTPLLVDREDRGVPGRISPEMVETASRRTTPKTIPTH